MCRRKQLCGICMIGFGLGLLVASFIESVFVCGCLGFCVAVVGVLVAQKK